MDIYVLNSDREREYIVDRFESFIWAERYAAFGDCDIRIPSNLKSVDYFEEGVWLVQNKSHRVMIVDTIEDATDAEGRSMTKINGRSLESIFEERLAAANKTALTNNTRWSIEDTPGNILRHILTKICIEGILDPNDVIPDLVVSPFPFIPEGTIPEPQRRVLMELEIKTLYETFTEICTTYSLGYSLLLNRVTKQLHFQVLTGTNRTSAQEDVEPVVFSPDFGNLANSSELVSSAKYKNVAIVTSDFGTVTVYADTAARSQQGFQRRVLHVRVTDIKESDTNKTALLTKKGQDELAKHRRIQAFDGEIPQRGYEYARAYFLGDITEMRKSTGSINYMRVTEQIFSDDAEGERSYPTLSLDSYISPGSWYAYSPNAAWYDTNEGITWASLPD